MAGNAWFRFYNDVINDPKVQMLPKALRWAWVELLCLASKSDGLLPPVQEIAFAARSSVNDAQADLDALILAGLIDIRPDGRLTPHNWAKRQYVSDSSTGRVRKFRARKQSETPMKRFIDVSVTPPEPDPDSDSDSDQDQNAQARAVSEQPLVNLGVGRGGSVSVDAKRTVCAKLGIGNSEPLLALYHSWSGSRQARDPDALFIKTAEGFYRGAVESVRRACQPLDAVADLPTSLPPVSISSSLLNSALVKGARRSHA